MTALLVSTDSGGSMAGMPGTPPPPPTRPAPRAGLPRRAGGPPRSNGQSSVKGWDLVGSGAGHTPRRPAAPRPASSKRPSNSDREAIIARIEMLWNHYEVPSWHRRLYSARYFEAGACRCEVLYEEACAIAKGTALVLVAMRAVQEREDALAQLKQLRTLYEDDEEFEEGSSAAAKSLIRHLQQLRSASVTAVEALSAWRRSVAPLRGGSSSVVGPSARGASWPHGPRQEDYLWIVAHRDEVVRSFDEILLLPPVSDPFLEQCSMPSRGEGAAAPGKLRLPAMQGPLAKRMQAAKLLLLEEEIGVVLSAGAPAPRDLRSLCKTASKNAALARLHKDTNSDKSVLPTLWPDFPQRPQSAHAHVAKHHDSPRGSRPSALMDQLSLEVLSRADASGSLCRPRSASPGKQFQRRKSWKVTDRVIPKTSKAKPSAIVLSKSKSGVSSEEKKQPSGGRSPRTVRRGSRLGADGSSQDDSLSRADIAEQEGSERRFSGEFFVDDSLGVSDYPLVSRTILGNLWKKYSHDQTMHHDTMPKLLEMAGLLHFSDGMEWIEDIFKGITKYNSIEHEDFWIFIQRYEERQRSAWNKSFAFWDADDSGSIDNSEFAGLLQSLGIEPMKDVLDEAIAEVDHDDSGELDLTEFYEVMKLLREREGFSRSESAYFMEVFEKFDRDLSGSIDTHELCSLLNYLGFSLDQNATTMISREVDVDGSGTLDKHEFLVCMRKVRDREVKLLKALIVEFDDDGNDMLEADQLHCLLNTLGYFVDDDVMEEVAAAVGMDLEESLDLESLWRFLLLFRAREGLSIEESDALDEAFKMYPSFDECPKGAMRTTEVGKVLRYMGYAMTFEEQQILTMQVDVAEKGFLKKCDVQKMIRMARDQEVKQAQEVFRRVAGPLAIGILLTDVSEAFRALGCVQQNGKTPRVTNDMVDPNGLTVSEESFLRMVRRQNKQNRHIFRVNGGFSEKDLADLKRRFNEFDVDHSGDITQGELIKLIETIFPRMSHDSKLRPKLLEIMKEVDQNRKGTLDFHDFLRLMRICRDQQDREALSKERRAVDECKFTPAEVHEFRDLFIGQPGLREGELPIPEIIKMVSSICKLGDKNTAELKEMLSDMQLAEGKGRIAPFEKKPPGQKAGYFGSSTLSSKKDDEGAEPDPLNPADWVDFADFLWLMRWILNQNFGDVKSQTQGAAARYKSSAGDVQRRNAKLVTGRASKNVDDLGDVSLHKLARKSMAVATIIQGWSDQEKPPTAKQLGAKLGDVLAMENLIGTTKTPSVTLKVEDQGGTDPRRKSMTASISPRASFSALEAPSNRRNSFAPGRQSRRASTLQPAAIQHALRRGSSNVESVEKGKNAVLKLAEKFHSDKGGKALRASFTVPVFIEPNQD